MKSNLLLYVGILTFSLLTACSEDKEDVPEQEGMVITIPVTVNEGDLQTKGFSVPRFDANYPLNEVYLHIVNGEEFVKLPIVNGNLKMSFGTENQINGVTFPSSSEYYFTSQESRYYELTSMGVYDGTSEIVYPVDDKENLFRSKNVGTFNKLKDLSKLELDRLNAAVRINIIFAGKDQVAIDENYWVDVMKDKPSDWKIKAYFGKSIPGSFDLQEKTGINTGWVNNNDNKFNDFSFIEETYQKVDYKGFGLKTISKDDTGRTFLFTPIVEGSDGIKVSIVIEHGTIKKYMEFTAFAGSGFNNSYEIGLVLSVEELKKVFETKAETEVEAQVCLTKASQNSEIQKMNIPFKLITDGMVIDGE